MNTARILTRGVRQYPEMFAAPGVQGVQAGDLGMLKENSQCTEQSVTTRNDLALAVSNVRVEISVVDCGD